MFWLVILLSFVIFLYLTNSFLQGGKKQSIASWLRWFWAGFIIAAIINFGWRGASVAAAVSLLAPVLLRGLAARLAALLMGVGAPQGGGSYPGVPSRALARVSRILGDYSSMQNPRQLLAEMTSGRPSKKDEALDQLLDLVTARPATAEVLHTTRTDREALRETYRRLVLAGAGQWAGAHFAAASALYYQDTLRFVLSAMDAGLSDMEIAYSVIEHFQSGSPLPDIPSRSAPH